MVLANFSRTAARLESIFEQLARLGVLDRQQPGGGQRALARVMQVHAYQVVAGVGEADFLDGAAAGAGLGEGGAEAVQEVGEQEHDRAPVQHAIQEGQGRRDVGAAVLGLEEEHLADEPQNVAPPFARRQEQLDLVGEQQQRDLVAAPRGGNGQRAGNLRRKLALGAAQRAERRGGRDVHRQHHRQFALLAVALHERPPHAIGDVPVNVADLIAGDILAQLLEIHAAALEVAQVGAHHGVVDQAVGAHLHAADAFEQFGNGHDESANLADLTDIPIYRARPAGIRARLVKSPKSYIVKYRHGTGTALKIFLMMASVVTACASAS